MGNFDKITKVKFKCSLCNKDIETFQTRDLGCNLKYYNSSDVDFNDIDELVEFCGNCSEFITLLKRSNVFEIVTKEGPTKQYIQCEDLIDDKEIIEALNE